MKKLFITPLALLSFVLAGCIPSIPTATMDPGMYYTQAAQTISADQTRLAALTPTPLPATLTPTFAPTLEPSLPPPQSGSSPTTDPCNQAQLLYDVNIPDNSIMSPNQTFTKIWMLRNIGACPWTSGYKLVFISGDPMAATTTPLLTHGSILRGQSIEATVTLKAPSGAGTYTGYWMLADASGRLFGLAGTPFWVRIKVVTTGTITISLNAVSFESGSVSANGAVSSEINVGDTVNKEGIQSFISFDISSIPTRATIDIVKLDLTQYELIGDPFGGMGCLDVYQQDYTPLNSGDHFTGTPSGAFMEWCDPEALNNVVADGDFATAIQARLGTDTRIQFRLQFPGNESNNDGMSDLVHVFVPFLIVQYTMP